MNPLLVRIALLSLVVATGASCATAQKGATKAISVAKCRAIQTEAQTALKTLVAAQESQKGARDTYAKSIGELGIDVEEASIHYDIKLVKVTKKTFVARATASDPDLGGDTWEIDGDGKLENTRDGCK